MNIKTRTLISILYLSCCLFAKHVSSAPELQNRIVTGIATKIENFPYIVTVFTDTFYCGGNIIEADKILTAAHCCMEIPSKYKIRAGSSYSNKNGIVVDVLNVIPHPDFDTETLENDICIIKLVQSLSLSNTIDVIQLATNHPSDFAYVDLYGYGDVFIGLDNFSNHLRTTKVKYISRKTCSKYCIPFMFVPEGALCGEALLRDSCQGDSGGPMAYNNELLAVVSNGFFCAVCPGVYTSVPDHLDWINSN